MMTQLQAQQKLQPLFDVVNAINRYPDLHLYLEKDAREWCTDKWLPMDNIVNGHVQVPDTLKTLMDQLCFQLHSLLIASNGQHAELFYQLPLFDYLGKTGERDSFGPLSSIFSPPGRPWYVCYG